MVVTCLQLYSLQEYLGDIAGSVPDHHNKASSTNFILFSQ
jgi:hypothetical protein